MRTLPEDDMATGEWESGVEDPNLDWGKGAWEALHDLAPHPLEKLLGHLQRRSAGNGDPDA